MKINFISLLAIFGKNRGQVFFYREQGGEWQVAEWSGACDYLDKKLAAMQTGEATIQATMVSSTKENLRQLDFYSANKRAYLIDDEGVPSYLRIPQAYKMKDQAKAFLVSVKNSENNIEMLFYDFDIHLLASLCSSTIKTIRINKYEYNCIICDDVFFAQLKPNRNDYKDLTLTDDDILHIESISPLYQFKDEETALAEL